MQRLISISYKTLLKKLHIAEHADFYDSNIIAPLITIVAALPTVSGIFNTLRTVYQQEDNLYKQSRALILTQDVKYLHAKRISLYVYFWNSVSINQYFDDPTLKQAAEKLEFLHKNYKSIPEAVYTDASGLLTNFFEDTEKPEWSAPIQSLGLTNLIGKAKTANDAFKAIYHERSFDKVQIEDLGKLKDIRIEVDDTFSAFIENLNAAWTTNELGAKDATLRTNLLAAKGHIYAAIEQAETNLAHRGYHHKNKDDDNTTDEGTQAPDTTNPPAPPTPPQQPDTTNPPAPNTPPQQPDTTIPPINPEDLNPPAAGE
ncbi:MAG: DUF6261 family protein [Tannerellaceae bacterium]|jgi:hypothetical protein|nr:DUF6261 family protein [Tannerellaceae bacterium]